MVLGPSQFAGQFSYYSDGSRSNPVSYLFAQDINRDGIEEVFFVAFETQFNTPENYSNTSVHIFGWVGDQFQEITQQWLPNNRHSVEGVGDVAFGDFDGNGFTDVFLSAYTDMEHPVEAYVLMNQGTEFTKQSLGLETWMHAVASDDINQDGFDDVIVAGYSDFHQYLGSPTGLIKYSGMRGSSGVALGDFLDNGTVTGIFVDAGSGTQDTALVAFDILDQYNIISLDQIRALPAPRLTTLGLETPTSSSHDIRARPFDFNYDGKLDVLVFSYLANYSSGLTAESHKSEIQFLENQGNGIFIDVTAEYRVGYDVTGYVGYYPQIIDINRDGRADIFTSQPDWMPRYNSTTMLLQQQDGVFLDLNRSQINEVIAGGQGLVVQGPNEQLFLVREGRWFWSDPVTKVYLHTLDFPEREQDEVLTGTNLQDQIFGLGGNDAIMAYNDGALAMPDSIDGGLGIDTALYQGQLSEYRISIDPLQDTTESDALSNLAITVIDSVANRDGVDHLIHTERLGFLVSEDSGANRIALDRSPQDIAGSAYLLYQAALGRAPEFAGLGYWIDRLDYGAHLVTDVANHFIHSPEFIEKYGASISDSQYIDRLYLNVLNRPGEEGGVEYWNGQLQSNLKSRAQILTEFATLPEYANAQAALIANGVIYEAWLGGP